MEGLCRILPASAAGLKIEMESFLRSRVVQGSEPRQKFSIEAKCIISRGGYSQLESYCRNFMMSIYTWINNHLLLLPAFTFEVYCSYGWICKGTNKQSL